MLILDIRDADVDEEAHQRFIDEIKINYSILVDMLFFSSSKSSVELFGKGLKQLLRRHTFFIKETTDLEGVSFILFCFALL
jgi:peroxiredoxin